MQEPEGGIRTSRHVGGPAVADDAEGGERGHGFEAVRAETGQARFMLFDEGIEGSRNRYTVAGSRRIFDGLPAFAGQLDGLVVREKARVPGHHIDAPPQVRDGPRGRGEHVEVRTGTVAEGEQVVDGVATVEVRGANVFFDSKLRHTRFGIAVRQAAVIKSPELFGTYMR